MAVRTTIEIPEILHADLRRGRGKRVFSMKSLIMERLSKPTRPPAI
jgi:hypothetical protein